MPMTNEAYDAIVIGSGQGGKPMAVDLAKAGHRTALIERGAVGGTCVNVGCTPTKTMYASARIAYLANRAHEYGIETGVVRTDVAAVRRRKQSLVDQFRGHDEQSILSTPNLDLIRGEARFTGPKAIEVKTGDGGVRRLDASRWILVNTGARPSPPDIAGIEAVKWLDSTSIMELDEAPKHLLVVGGGYIGVEFGQMFARFGSKVTIIHRQSQLLGQEDADVAEAVEAILREDGIDVRCNTSCVRAALAGDQIALDVKRGDETTTLRGDRVLIATGRQPNTEKLDVAAAGIELDDKGFIRADERLETSAPGVYAIGDVKGGPQFTHISWDDYRILRANLLRGENATTSKRLVPYVVFMDPQLGRVGITEKQARASGIDFRVAKVPMEYSARANEAGEKRGLMKAIVDAKSDRILGCAMLGMEGGELMAMLEIAMLGGLTATVLREAIFAHPTLAETLNALFGAIA